jgi:hypothetical protein
MVEHARPRSSDFSLNHHRGGLLFRATELRITVRIARVRQLDTLKTVKKVDMPPISPEFSIGHNFEADSFLQSDCFPDAFVFDSLKSRNVDFPLTGICPGLMEFGRPQKATDMFDVEKKFFRLHSFAPGEGISPLDRANECRPLRHLRQWNGMATKCSPL